jgi:hypothetical protein
MRIGMRHEYLSWDPQAWYLPVSPTAAFDGLVHVRHVRATMLLSQRPRLEIDGEDADVKAACYLAEDGIAVTFAGGSLTSIFVYDPEIDAVHLDMTLVLGGVTYNGMVPVANHANGWAFAGRLLSGDSAEVEVAGFTPYDLTFC